MLNSSVNYNFSNLVYISTLLIYFRFIPIDVETFPLLVIIVLLLGLSIMLIEAKPLYSNGITTLSLFSFVILSYGIIGFIYSPSSALEMIKYLIGPFILMTLLHFNADFNPKIILASILIVFFLTIAVMLHFGPVISFLKLFIARNQFNFGFRGISAITAEPSYFAPFIMLFIVLLLDLKSNSLIEKRKFLVYMLMVSVMGLLTLSAYSLLVLLFFWLFYLWNTNKFIVIVFVGLVLIIFLFPEILPENRVTQIIQFIKQLFSGDNFLNVLLFYDPSGSTRLILNAIGIINIFIHPFGTGYNSFGSNIVSNSSILNIDVNSHEVISAMNYDRAYAQTYYANIANDIGLFSLLMVYLFFSNGIKNNPIFKNTVFVFFILFFMFQIQITNPVPWIILYICVKKRRSNVATL